jgi:hypothetical protein
MPSESCARADTTCQLLRYGVFGPAGLPDGDKPGDERTDKEESTGAQHDPEASVDAELVLGAVLRGTQLGFGKASALGQEVVLGRGQRGSGVLLPIERSGEPDATVELAFGTAETVPRVRRDS